MLKSKGLKIFIIVIFIVFFLSGVFSIYKFIVINKIFEKMKEYVKKENYYMKIINAEDDSEVMQIYYKDGIGKMLTSDNMYTWTDGNEAYLVNNENAQIQTLTFDSPLLISNEYVGSILPGYSKNIFEKFLLAGDIKTSVKLKKYEGIKYYIITTNEEYEKKIWIKYDTLIPSQTSAKIGNFTKTYNYDIRYDIVKDEDVKKPNLNNYTMVE